MLWRRIVVGAVIMVGVAVLGWTYYRSLVPAIHPDHDHALENIAGGGFLRVEAVEGGQRNLVGRPGRVLILHWFELGGGLAVGELPGLVDYANSVADDPGVDVRTVTETLIYDAEGHLVHQARGPMDCSSAETRAAIEGFKAGGGEHTH